MLQLKTPDTSAKNGATAKMTPRWPYGGMCLLDFHRVRGGFKGNLSLLDTVSFFPSKWRKRTCSLKPSIHAIPSVGKILPELS